MQSVTAEGQPLSFIQEDKNEDGNFAVILSKPLNAGDKVAITTTYAGKDAVSNEGGGNCHFPVARENWYPNDPGAGFGEYALYDMTLRIPKGMKMAATGVLVSESNDGGHNTTVWKSENPQTVAGFSFGRFKEEEVKLTQPEYFIQSYANEESPNWVQGLQHAVNDDLPNQSNSPLGSSCGVGDHEHYTVLNKKAMAEGEMAVRLYSDYFRSPRSSKHMHKFCAANGVQLRPVLAGTGVDSDLLLLRHHRPSLPGSRPRRPRTYWKVVTAHEVAHQWWGHTVGFSSGRDQWMSRRLRRSCPPPSTSA